MHVRFLRSAKSVDFASRQLTVSRPKKTAITYLHKQSSFIIAALMLTAFVMGNMLGKHGWEVFWRSVLGREDLSAVTYDGTVPPVAKVPDYSRWQEYGGNPSDHTFRQVPKDLLISLPRYRVDSTGMPTHPIYSVGYMGSYHGHEGKGSHPGIDIRLPDGTPIQAVANAFVDKVGNNKNGFGKYVVLKHPNVPDPSDPKKLITLYSVYAHLSAQFVEEKAVVKKGEIIGLSGRTGRITGPHLHFQMDREESEGGEETPWHPYWPFSNGSLVQGVNSGRNQSLGYKFTVHPMQYVQSNFSSIAITKRLTDDDSLIASADPEKALRSAAPKKVERKVQPRTVSSRRVAKTRPSTRSTRRIRASAGVSRRTALRSRIISRREERKRTTTNRFQRNVPTKTVTTTAPVNLSPVAGVQVQHDGAFSEGVWETVRLTLVDDKGVTTSAEGLERDLYLRASFGRAKFQPDRLRKSDFVDGVATIRILPESTKTIVIDAQPFEAQGKPLAYGGR